MMLPSAFSGILSSGIRKDPVASERSDYITKHETDKHDMSQVNDDLVEKIECPIQEDDWVNYIIQVDDTVTLINLFDKRADKSVTYPSFMTTRTARVNAENIKKTHAAVFKRISRQIEMKFVASYTDLVNAFAVKIRYKDRYELELVADKAGALSVSLSNTYDRPLYDLVENEVDVWETGIFKRPDAALYPELNYKGEGMFVAVLDTGLDYTHAAFSEDNLPTDKSVLRSKAEIAARLPYLSAYDLIENPTINDFYMSAKVPFAFDYADLDNEVNTAEENMHGTHVSGIIVGKSEDPIGKLDPLGRQVVGIEGVAPLAQIAAMKVFNDQQAGTDDTVILPALQDCVKLGVDVINMSLGQGSGLTDDRNPVITQAYEEIGRRGISLVVAAGNSASSGAYNHYGLNLPSNPDSGTVSSPATYMSAFSVGSIEGVKAPYFVARDNNNTELGIAYIRESSNPAASYGYDSYNFVDGLFDIITNPLNELYSPAYASYYNEATGIMRIPYVSIPSIGDAGDYANLGNIDVGGKIALIRRGKTTFISKLSNARDAGAIGGVVYNNVSGLIGMSIDDTVGIPSCSITMSAASKFRDVPGRQGILEFKVEIVNDGNVMVKSAYGAGPFVSEFSAWGALSDLTLKPEITAHGGEIYSAAPGEDNYARISGTSMAAPNAAGLVLLTRQHVKKFADKYGVKDDKGIIDDNKLENRVYQLMMCTATLPKNEEGNPYSPRKVGAGLADITGMMRTDVFLYVPDPAGLDGMKGRTKLELFDDPGRTGVYDMEFVARNLSNTAKSYKLRAVTMTERLSIDSKTVAEMSHMLDNTAKQWWVNGVETPDGIVTVPANGEARINVKLTLTPDDKKFIEDRFVNGMYVEGFIRLDAYDLAKAKTYDELRVTPGGIPADEVKNIPPNLGVPYLAFFGNWLDAPMFDESVYVTDKDLYDSNLLEDDKTYAQGRPLQLWAKLIENNTEYVIPVGTFLFYVPDGMEDRVPYATSERTAISLNKNAANELYFVTGFLRAAKTVDWEIRSKVTGQLMAADQATNARKDSRSNFGGPRLEIDPERIGCAVNVTYTLSLVAQLDFQRARDEKRFEHFSIDFVIDGDAPIITNAEIRVERNTQNDYQRYLDFYIHDDNYLQAMDFSLYEKFTEEYYSIYERGILPINGDKNAITRITFNLTSAWEYIKDNEYKIAVRIYDGTFNMSYYEINLETMVYTAAKTLAFGDIGIYSTYTSKTDPNDTRTILTSNTESVVFDADGNFKRMTNIEIRPYQSVKLEFAVVSTPANVWVEDLEWTSNNTGIVSINKKTGEIFAVSPGSTFITVRSKGNNSVSARLNITVLSPAEMAEYDRLNPINPNVTNLSGVKITTGYTRELRAGEQYAVEAEPLPWFTDPDNVEVKWSSMRPRVATVVADPQNPFKATITAAKGYIDEKGKYIENSDGIAEITVTVQAKNTLNPYVYSIWITVHKEYIVEAGTLTKYNGSDAVVNIPESLKIKTIGRNAFANRHDITEVTVPEGVDRIEYAAFYFMKNLKKIKLPSTIKFIDEWAFAGHATGRDGITTALNVLDTTAFVNPVQVGARAFINQLVLGTDVAVVNFTNYYPWYAESDIKFFGTSYTKFDTKMFRSIGGFAFYNCNCLSEIDLTGARYLAPMALAYVGNDAAYFSGVYPGIPTLGYLNLKFSADTSLGPQSVYYTGIKNLTLPMSRIPMLAFAVSPFLQNVTFTGENLVVERYAFSATFMEAEYMKGPGSITFKGTVDYIGDYAFSDQQNPCVELNSLTFEKTVRHIGEGAFYRAGLPATLTLPGGLEYLGEAAFGNNTNLTTLRIPANLTALVNMGRAFSGNSNFRTIQVLPGNPKYSVSVVSESDILVYGEGGDYEMVLVPNGKSFTSFVVPAAVTVLGENAFGFNRNLTTVDLSNVREIKPYAMANMPSLTSVTLPADFTDIPAYFLYGSGASGGLTVTNTSNIQTVGEYAFANSSVRTISLAACTEMGSGAFSGSRLTSFTIPTGITKVPTRAFNSAAQLTSVTFHSGVTEIGDYAFSSSGLTSVVAGGVTKIGNSAFSGCNSLAEAQFSNATEIGSRAFYATSGRGYLSTLNIGAARTIGNSAFENQSRLTGTYTLNYVTNIGAYAFARTGIPSIRMGNVVSIGEGAFMGCSSFRDTSNTSGRLTIPTTTTYIGPLAFAQSGVREFAVAAGNPLYKTIEGVLFKTYQGGAQELVAYPAASQRQNSYDVPEGTVRIAEFAFYGVGSISFVTLPSTLTNIGHKAFFDSRVSTYKFMSLNAPILEAAITRIDADDQTVYYWAVYANFYSYFSPSENLTMRNDAYSFDDLYRYNTITSSFSNDNWRSADAQTGANISVNGSGDKRASAVYNLNMIRPGNGVGYTDFVYAYYFDNVDIWGEILEANTQKVINLIAALPSAQSVNSYTLAARYKPDAEEARREYERLTPGQKMLVNNYTALGTLENKINQLFNSTDIYDVVFMIDGRLYGSVQKVASGQTANEPVAPERADYTFDGWFAGDTRFNFGSTSISASIILEGRFKSAFVTVTFAGDVDMEPLIIPVGTRAEKPDDPVRDGYRFNGWYAGNVEYDFDLTVGEDITLTARWTKKACCGGGTISLFNGGGGLLLGLLTLATLLGLASVLLVKRRRVKTETK